MTVITDARNRPRGKMTGSTRRLNNKIKGTLRDAVRRKVLDTSIGDITEDGVDVFVSSDDYDMSEPTFRNGEGGVRKRVLPGNDQFSTGDRVRRPERDSGGGSGKASKDGEGEDGFIYRLNRDEFLDIFFADCGLPNLSKKGIMTSSVSKPKRSGYASSGPESRINLARTKRESKARMIPARAPDQREIEALLLEKKALLSALDPGFQDGTSSVKSPFSHVADPIKVRILKLESEVDSLLTRFGGGLDDNARERINAIDEQISVLKDRVAMVPGYDPIDRRYNRFSSSPLTVAQAVVFCIMDVSGSMDETKKYIAKSLYVLLDLFLEREYDHVDLVFIRHHTIAKECDQDEFFHSKETGGTVVASGISMMRDIIRSGRYPEDKWNMYAMQTSDGDSWGKEDDMQCVEMLKDVMSSLQAFFYAEITAGARQSLWYSYTALAQKHKDKFFMQNLAEPNQVGQVFRQFFKKRTGEDITAGFRQAAPAPGI